MRFISSFAFLLTSLGAVAQEASLPDAPSTVLLASVDAGSSSSVTLEGAREYSFYPVGFEQDAAAAAKASDKGKQKPMLGTDLDKDGHPIPLSQQQPQRILGFMPNFRSVSAGGVPPKPGWKLNFKVATRQSFDYSSFLFLGITSLSAEGINSHPVLGKGVGGFYAYTWRGFLDKTDGTYLGAWFLPSLLHEDTRYYAMGSGNIAKRILYVISRQGVTRTYGGRQTPNIAGLGGKVLTQVISREYYPAGATDFSVLATKFGYSAMRDVAFTSIREFYPQIAAHYIRKHREKMARLAASQNP
ncbi:hypothetical protein SAMN05421771_2256 [Granulicella pectinivorans]|uniref:Uncharacterized protein n=1 Tax=Granulicella pectinivorans TaxID=474950 RepID=A0A1I6MC18_9BACT|nr:hypothetical protein SAMN05421771_2256 [Granulicella pectinivorans]